MSILKGFC